MRDYKLIRLFVEENLSENLSIILPKEQSHYLATVMRRKIKDHILVFDGVNGEFEAEIIDISKNAVDLKVKSKTKTQPDKNLLNIALLYSPVKNAKSEFIVQKATELGVSIIQPIITERTIKNKTNTEKLKVVAVEAAEQSERLDIPRVLDIQKLDFIIKDFSEYQIIIADETGQGSTFEYLSNNIKVESNKIAVIIGPEGGFSNSELEKLSKLPNSNSVGLGPRILRAETAIMASLALVQSYFGDLSIQPDFRG